MDMTVHRNCPPLNILSIFILYYTGVANNLCIAGDYFYGIICMCGKFYIWKLASLLDVSMVLFLRQFFGKE